MSNSLDFIAQALNDYAQTLAPSVRAAFAQHANAALTDVQQQLQRAAGAGNVGPATE